MLQLSPAQAQAPLTFYPAYCFPVSPTFNTWAKVTATEVHALQEHEGFEGTLTSYACHQSYSHSDSIAS